MNIKIVGIDLAKDVSQICLLNRSNNVVFNRCVVRAALRKEVGKLTATTIAMEACGSAHYWGREFQAMGHKVMLIPPQHVKAYVVAKSFWPRFSVHSSTVAQPPWEPIHHCEHVA